MFLLSSSQAASSNYKANAERKDITPLLEKIVPPRPSQAATICALAYSNYQSAVKAYAAHDGCGASAAAEHGDLSLVLLSVAVSHLEFYVCDACHGTWPNAQDSDASLRCGFFNALPSR